MIRKILLCLSIIIITELLAFSLPIFSQESKQLNTTLQFYVYGFQEGKEKSNRTYLAIDEARVIIIDNINGKVITHGLTDKNGYYSAIDIPINTDPRFPFRDIGTVTVITVADGFNENINFNVSAQYEVNTKRVYLEPLLFEPPHRRNEPTFKNGDYHRLTVFEMLNYYAKQIGLSTQKTFPGYDDLHWSPKLNKNNL
jgi:hypothetical protein